MLRAIVYNIETHLKHFSALSLTNHTITCHHRDFMSYQKSLFTPSPSFFCFPSHFKSNYFLSPTESKDWESDISAPTPSARHAPYSRTLSGSEETQRCESSTMQL